MRFFINTQLKNIRTGVMPRHVKIEFTAGDGAQIQVGK